MPRPSADPTQRAIVAELLATDADLRAVARDFVLSGLRDLVALQKRGDPAIRAQLARALAGPIVAAITEPVEEDGFAAIRSEMQEMMSEVRDALVPPRAADELPHLPTPD